MYAFLLNMWVMRRVTDVQLQTCLAKKQLTQDEYDMIIVTPQK
ncbi:hypothetical protein [Brevibacillus sp. SIMBA_040]